jgi:hypothetical protein
MLGTGLCLALSSHPVMEGGGAASLANLGLFVLLLGSLGDAHWSD